MEKKGLNEDQIARLQKLAGIKIITESEEPKNSLANLEFNQKGADGITYGVVKENSQYFIKKTTSQAKGTLNESDFVYIGGLANKN